MDAMYAVILAGGRGERFWPISRYSRPKQFVTIFGGKPLLRLAVERLSGLIPPSRMVVVTSADLVESTRAVLPELSDSQVVGEPFGRDTAAACALGTAWVASRGGEDATVVVLTADHVMADAVVFRQTLLATARTIRQGGMIGTIGIVPTYPATGYGYLEVGDVLEGTAGEGVTPLRRVKRFVEKPDEETAREYVASGHHYWNSGMFLWTVRTFWEALELYQRPLFEMVKRLAGAWGQADFAERLQREYEQLEKISVDYAVMEKAHNLVAAPGNFGWDDVGTWVSAAAHLASVGEDNRLLGEGEFLEAQGNTLVNEEPGHVVAVMGAKDLVVVHTSDATLVCTKEQAAKLKTLVQQIAANRGKQFI